VVATIRKLKTPAYIWGKHYNNQEAQIPKTVDNSGKTVDNRLYLGRTVFSGKPDHPHRWGVVWHRSHISFRAVG
jgi:hypothetical protein